MLPFHQVQKYGAIDCDVSMRHAAQEQPTTIIERTCQNTSMTAAVDSTPSWGVAYLGQGLNPLPVECAYGRTMTFKEFKWEKSAKSGRLFISAGWHMGKVFFGLSLMAWSLLSENDYLMRCHSGLPRWARFLCELTKSHMRSFPGLAAAISIFLGMRRVLQRRVYYGLLKHKGLMSFNECKTWHDPLSGLMGISLVIGFSNFVLKGYFLGLKTFHAMLMMLCNRITINCMLFFVFFHRVHKIEKDLISLSKFMGGKDWESMKQFVAGLENLEEDSVRRLVTKTDIVAKAAKHEAPRLSLVYECIMRSHLEPNSDSLSKHVEHIFWGPFAETRRTFWSGATYVQTMWPAELLFDGRLVDRDSIFFRRAFQTANFVCLCVQGMILMAYFTSALREVKRDVLGKGETEDITAVFTYSWHAVLHIWILVASVRGTIPGLNCFRHKA